MSIFASKNVRVYEAASWEKTASEKLDAEDVALFNGAKVVTSKQAEFGTGLSVCFFLKSGGYQYIPVSLKTNVMPEAGQAVDFNKIEIETLSRTGDNDIYRVNFLE